MNDRTKFSVSSMLPLCGGRNIRAIVSVVINDDLVIKGIKVLQGKSGLFLDMPSRKTGGVYSYIAYPVTYQARKQLNEAVLNEYRELLSKREYSERAEAPTQRESSVSVSIHSADDNNISALGQIIIDNCFVIKGIRVIESEEQIFVFMPSFRTSDFKTEPFASPITPIFRDKIYKAVCSEYRNMRNNERSFLCG